MQFKGSALVPLLRLVCGWISKPFWQAWWHVDRVDQLIDAPIDPLSLKVGDVLVSRVDYYFKPHHAHYGHRSYPENRRFTAGKEYKVVNTRRKTRIVFVVNDSGFHSEELNAYKLRRFYIKPAVSNGRLG